MCRQNTMAGGWHKSSRSNPGECVEVRFGPLRVHVRDSKDRHGPTLEFTHPEWRAFLSGAQDGEFDLPDGLEGQA